ncbi:MAG: sugar transferase [Melioribacteraceae bacterium]|nr:sugar transferase [Melioribacteraceae bacterium]
MGNILIIGACDQAYFESIKYLYGSLKKYKLIGFIDDTQKLYSKVFENYSIVGRVYQVPFLVKKFEVKKIIVIADQLPKSSILEVIETGKLLKVDVKLVSENFTMFPKEKNFFKKILSIENNFLSNLNKKLFWLTKRTVDVLFSIVGLVYFLPIFILYFSICGFKKSNIILVNRITKHGKLFSLRKLNLDINEFSGKYEIMVKKLFLKYSLDYLPSFINILKGELSFIGQRAYTLKEFNLIYGKQRCNISCRPGIASFWQVAVEPDIDKKEMLLFDRYYNENPSFGLEMKILVLLLINGYNFRKEAIKEKTAENQLLDN